MNENLTLIRIAEKYIVLSKMLLLILMYSEKICLHRITMNIYINSKECNKNSLPIIFNHGILIGSDIKD